MKLRFDLQKSVIMPGGLSVRYVDGEYEESTGIVWLSDYQGATPTTPGRKVKAGMGLHLASKTSVQRLDPEPAIDAAKPVAKKGAAA